jgi:hypothetical protein
MSRDWRLGQPSDTQKVALPRSTPALSHFYFNVVEPHHCPQLHQPLQLVWPTISGRPPPARSRRCPHAAPTVITAPILCSSGRVPSLRSQNIDCRAPLPTLIGPQYLPEADRAAPISRESSVVAPTILKRYPGTGESQRHDAAFASQLANAKREISSEASSASMTKFVRAHIAIASPTSHCCRFVCRIETRVSGGVAFAVFDKASFCFLLPNFLGECSATAAWPVGRESRGAEHACMHVEVVRYPTPPSNARRQVGIQLGHPFITRRTGEAIAFTTCKQHQFLKHALADGQSGAISLRDLCCLRILLSSGCCTRRVCSPPNLGKQS